MPPGWETDDWALKTPAKSDVGLKTRRQRGYALGFDSELVDLLDRLQHVGHPSVIEPGMVECLLQQLWGFPFGPC